MSMAQWFMSDRKGIFLFLAPSAMAATANRLQPRRGRAVDTVDGGGGGGGELSARLCCFLHGYVIH